MSIPRIVLGERTVWLPPQLRIVYRPPSPEERAIADSGETAHHRVALHEAGHAVAALHLGFPCLGIRSLPSFSWHGDTCGVMVSQGVADVPFTSHTLGTDGALAETRYAEAAVIALAGRAAEHLFTTRGPDGAGQDLRDARTALRCHLIARGHDDDQETVDDLMVRASGEASALVSDAIVSGGIVAVANRLLFECRGEIRSEDELRSICRDVGASIPATPQRIDLGVPDARDVEPPRQEVCGQARRLAGARQRVAASAEALAWWESHQDAIHEAARHAARRRARHRTNGHRGVTR